MKITVQSTSKLVTVDGVPARVWQGHTEDGIAVHCFITRIGVDKDEDCSRFEADLKECAAPTEEVAAIPSRLAL